MNLIRAHLISSSEREDFGRSRRRRRRGGSGGGGSGQGQQGRPGQGRPGQGRQGQGRQGQGRQGHPGGGQGRPGGGQGRPGQGRPGGGQGPSRGGQPQGRQKPGQGAQRGGARPGGIPGGDGYPQQRFPRSAGFPQGEGYAEPAPVSWLEDEWVEEDPGFDEEPFFEEESWEGRRRWGPQVGLGQHLRLQARAGYRAAVIPLRPGLHLVAELPEQAAQSEFGVAPVLVPLMLNAATRALVHREPEQPGLVQRLAQGRQRRLESGTAVLPQLQLRANRGGQPAPPTTTALVPAPGSVSAATPVVWAHPLEANQALIAGRGCGCGSCSRCQGGW